MKQANEQKGYFLTDGSTWVAAKKEMNNSTILFKGDRFLADEFSEIEIGLLDSYRKGNQKKVSDVEILVKF